MRRNVLSFRGRPLERLPNYLLGVSGRQLMRRLALLAVGAVALSILVAPTLVGKGGTARAATTLAGPSAAQLLNKIKSCKQISTGKYKTDDETGRTIAVCGANGG